MDRWYRLFFGVGEQEISRKYNNNETIECLVVWNGELCAIHKYENSWALDCEAIKDRHTSAGHLSIWNHFQWNYLSKLNDNDKKRIVEINKIFQKFKIQKENALKIIQYSFCLDNEFTVKLYRDVYYDGFLKRIKESDLVIPPIDYNVIDWTR